VPPVSAGQYSTDITGQAGALGAERHKTVACFLGRTFVFGLRTKNPKKLFFKRRLFSAVDEWVGGGTASWCGVSGLGMRVAAVAAMSLGSVVSLASSSVWTMRQCCRWSTSSPATPARPGNSAALPAYWTAFASAHTRYDTLRYEMLLLMCNQKLTRVSFSLI